MNPEDKLAVTCFTFVLVMVIGLSVQSCHPEAQRLARPTTTMPHYMP